MLLLPLAAAAALVAAAAVPAATVLLRASVKSGSLNVAPAAVRMPELRGTPGGTSGPTYPVTLTVTDSTGSGRGWRLAIISTGLVPTGTTPPRKLRKSALVVTGATVRCAAGGSCTAPVNKVRYPVSIPVGSPRVRPVNALSAAKKSGLGRFAVVLEMGLKLPAHALPGTYSTTIWLAVASGP